MFLEVCADTVYNNDAVGLCKLPNLLWQLLLQLRVLLGRPDRLPWYAAVGVRFLARPAGHWRCCWLHLQR
jgi:hypothetical protein